jgi:hypothetical protein
VQWRDVAEVEQFMDCPHLYFPPSLFRESHAYFEIDYSTAVTENCMVVKDGNPCHESCMEGVLVKLLEPQRIWRLTGNAVTEQCGGLIKLRGYEGKWPD